MLKFLKKWLKRNKADNNGEVYIHKPTANIYLLNSEGKLEGNTDEIPFEHINVVYLNKNNKLVIELNREFFEFIGFL